MSVNRRQVLGTAATGLVALISARSGRAQPQGMKALVFDTFGTVVDRLRYWCTSRKASIETSRSSLSGSNPQELWNSSGFSYVPKSISHHVMSP